MDKNNVLYHGSPTLIEGPLVPNQARGVGGGNNLKAIYATDNMNWAIAMGFRKYFKGYKEVKFENSNNGKRNPTIIYYSGKNKIPDKIYLYLLPKENFSRSSVKNQYFSNQEVLPLEIKLINNEDKLVKIRKANLTKRVINLTKWFLFS